MKTKRIQIKDLKPGMKIKTLSEDGTIVFKAVEKVWDTHVPSSRQRELIFNNGSKLVCSDTHPIMVRSGDYIIEKYPDDLTYHDTIIGTMGDVNLEKINSLSIDPNFTDIEVDETETFFASANETGPMVLTHNCSQGGVRGAAATVSYPWWHYEFEELIVLKNNKGTEETRERHVDYSVQFNDFFLDLVEKDEDVYVFCPKDSTDLQHAFYSGNDENFAEEYYKAIKNPNIRSKNIGSARSVVLGLFLSERHSTGRIYCQNMSSMVNNGPFKELVQRAKYWLTSNLCQEIALPVEGFEVSNTVDGMIALCTLSSINWGMVNKVEDLELPCRMSVRALDNLLSYQEYPVKQAETFVKRFRALGIGIVGLAHFLAKRGLKYNIDAVVEVDKYMEAMAYYLTDESVRLAEERGSCKWSDTTCYGKGVFPWELRNKNVDLIVPHETRFDWEELRERMIKFGIRNATLMAVAPTESSAQLLGETNGIEPPVAPVTVKSSKDGLLKTVVPGIQRLKNKYDYRWDQKNPRGYLTIMAVLQKWVDQTISTNTSYNPDNYQDQQIKMSDLVKDFMYAMRTGLKSLYYDNTNDGSGETQDSPDLSESVVVVEEDDPCGGACSI